MPSPSGGYTLGIAARRSRLGLGHFVLNFGNVGCRLLDLSAVGFDRLVKCHDDTHELFALIDDGDAFKPGQTRFVGKHQLVR